MELIKRILEFILGAIGFFVLLSLLLKFHLPLVALTIFASIQLYLYLQKHDYGKLKCSVLAILFFVLVFVVQTYYTNKDKEKSNDVHQSFEEEQNNELNYNEIYDDGYNTGWSECYNEIARTGEFNQGAKEALSWVIDSIPLTTYTEEEFEDFIYICDYVGKMDEDYLNNLKNQYYSES